MLDKKNINGAENILFDMLEEDNNDHMLIAIDFYNRLSSMADDELQSADFSRDEIDRGLREIKSIYG